MVNINGPINYCHMKGIVNGVEKKITLFMDKHLGLDEQTRCESFDSIDISHYMYKEIKNANQKVDFFLEITTDEIKSKQTNKRDIYIKEVFEMFKSEFVVEKINDKDIIRYSKSNPNVRLHFFDIREFMDIVELSSIVKDKISNSFEKLLQSNDNNQKKNISNKILDYFKIINIKLDKLTNDKNEIINLGIYTNNFDNDKQKYYINKAINKCENQKLRYNLIIFLENNYYNTKYNLDIAVNNIKVVLKNIENSNIVEIKKIFGYMEFIGEAILDLYSLFVDCYLLRRILNKDYIKNSIIYTGIQHSIHYIYFLHKYYGFEIIKIHHLEKSQDEMLKNIDDTNLVFEIYKYIFVNKYYPQCIPYNPMLGGNPYMEYLKEKIASKKNEIILF